MTTALNDDVAITYFLREWQDGDAAAREELARLVYDELRRIARSHLRRERDPSMQPTELVNEAFLRLVEKENKISFEDRLHFFGIAAHLMRQIICEQLRRKRALKRGGIDRDVALDEVPEIAQQRSVDLVELDDALRALEALDPTKSKLVELRYFAGLTIEETAQVLSVSVSTVKREWVLAKVWLYRYMTGGGKYGD